jgi:anti-sigma regulatory factor (Ser/Thr protein kinase)
VRELALHVLDVMENSVEAGATIVALNIEEDSVRDTLTITVTDNGRGMTRETVAKVLDPFFTTRTTRHVGLGLPLFAAAAQRCKGALGIESKPGAGTKVTASFQRSHLDRAPLGDVGASVLAVILSEHPVDVQYRHTVDGRRFEFDTVEIRKELADVPLTHPRVRDWLEGALDEDRQLQEPQS